MSYGESVNEGRFIQKTVKEDLILIFSHVYLRQKQLQKTLEATRRQPTEADPESMTCWAGWPSGPTYQPLFATTVLHCLKD